MGLAVVIKVKTTTHSTAAVLGLHATAPYGPQRTRAVYNCLAPYTGNTSTVSISLGKSQVFCWMTISTIRHMQDIFPDTQNASGVFILQGTWHVSWKQYLFMLVNLPQQLVYASTICSLSACRSCVALCNPWYPFSFPKAVYYLLSFEVYSLFHQGLCSPVFLQDCSGPH